jgi:hypothetical protein
MTPTDVITSVNKCHPSAAMAGDRILRPNDMRQADHAALIAVASPLSISPSPGCSIVRGCCSVPQASRRMKIAATMMSAPSTTAEKYSAL